MKTRIIAAAAIATLASAPAFATNGMFSHGFGMKSKGMAGAGSVSSKEALVGATNPASISNVGNRIDFGVDIFSPQRESIVRNFGLNNGTHKANQTDIFPIPEFGYVRQLNDVVTGAFLVYGNGGMNTDYDCGIFSSGGAGCNTGSPETGIDYNQMFISPTLSWKLNERHNVGIALNVAYSWIKVDGISNFGGLSSAPGSMTDRGYDGEWGLGATLGWTGKITDQFTAGLAYRTRTYMEKHDKYKGLFSDQGDLDVPATATLGLAFQATPALNVAFDVQHIFYSDVEAIGNKNTGSCTLGASSNSCGFGWDDMTVFKLGAEYQATGNLVIRGGISHGDQPIPSGETSFNVLAPGVVEDHATLGFTYTFGNGNELTGAYMHAFENSVNGNSGAGATVGQKLTMYQDSIGFTYSWMLDK